MRRINRKLFLTLKIVYIIAFLIYVVIAVATPQTAEFRTIQGGMIEITLLITSIVLFHNLKIRLALISGILGTIILGIDVNYSANLINSVGYYSWLPEVIHIDIYTSYYIINPICWITILCVNIILFIGKLRDKKIDFNKIKEGILDLGVKFTRLEIKAISEKFNQDPALIVEVIQDMVDKQEIYGVYFNSTKTVTFNQQANIDETDQLMAKFKE